MTAVTSPIAASTRAGLPADPRDGEDPQRDPPVEPVDLHRPGEEERPHEQEDDRVGELRQHRPRVGDAEQDRTGAAPSSAVTGSGSASLTHSTDVSTRIALEPPAPCGVSALSRSRYSDQ